MPDDLDFSALVGEPDPTQRANALANALRGLRQQQTLGQLGMLAGQTPVGQMGASVAQEASQGQNRLLQGAMHGQELMTRMAEARQGRQDTLEFKRAQLQQQEDLQAAKLGLQAREVKIDPQTGKTYFTHAGGVAAPLRRVGGGPPAAPTQSPTPAPTPANPTPDGSPSAAPADIPLPAGRNLNVMQRAANQLNADLDAFKRGSGLQQIGMTQNRAAKLKALIVDPQTGQLRQQITPQQMYEITLALQQMVAVGQASEREVEALLPKSLWGDATRALQYFSGKPMDANQKEWAKNILESAERESGVSQDFLNKQFAARIPANYAIVKKLHPPTLSGILEAHGMDPTAFDERGVIKPGTSPFLNRGTTAQPGQGQIVTKKEINRKTNQTRITYSDGTTEIRDGIQ